MREVICITECEYSIGSTYHQFNIGDKYQLSYLQPSGEDRVMCVDVTDSSELYQHSITVLKSDFVTLEEWRELQINKIIVK